MLVVVIVVGEFELFGVLWFVVEDQLGVGVVVFVLFDCGIDYMVFDVVVVVEGFCVFCGVFWYMVGVSGLGCEFVSGVVVIVWIEVVGLMLIMVVDVVVVDVVDVVLVLCEGVFI